MVGDEIPEQIASNNDPYYKALEEADKAWAQNKIDVSALEELLGTMLAQQLLNAVKEAAGEDVGPSGVPTLH